MGTIYKDGINYSGGGGSGKTYTGANGIDVDNTTDTISANNTLARTSQVPTKVSDLTNDSGYQDASEVDSKIASAVSSVFTYKGTVATVSALPNNASVGDVYNVDADGLNYAYDGTNWSPLAGTFDTSNLIENPTTKTAGQILEYNGTQWIASNGKFVRYTGTGNNGVRIQCADSLVNFDFVADTNTYNGYNGTALSITAREIGVYKRKASDNTLERKATYLPEEDTGWQVLEGEYIDVKYRKKNGVVYMTFSGCYLKKEIPGSAGGATVTNCQIPNELVQTQHITANVQGSVGAVGKGFMIVRPDATQGIQFRLTEPITMATNQSISMTLSYPV